MGKVALYKKSAIKWLGRRRMAGTSENGWNVGEWLERRRMGGALETSCSVGECVKNRRMCYQKAENIGEL